MDEQDEQLAVDIIVRETRKNKILLSKQEIIKCVLAQVEIATKKEAVKIVKKALHLLNIINYLEKRFSQGLIDEERIADNIAGQTNLDFNDVLYAARQLSQERSMESKGSSDVIAFPLLHKQINLIIQEKNK